MSYIIFLFSFFIAVIGYASNVEVYLHRWKIEKPVKDLLLVTEVTNKYELPTPAFELGESQTNLAEQLSALNKCDTIVAATVIEVTPIAITGIKDRYFDGYSSPLFWYRMQCEVKNVIKGRFPYSSLEFVATYGGDRLAWQFVRGYAFYFGLKEVDGRWEVIRYYRTSPLPPYKIENHINYFKMRRENPDFDWSQSDTVIKNAEKNIGRWCRDAALEKKKYLIMTFDGDGLWGNLNLDYGNSVTIITNKWRFPLPNNYIP